MIKLAVFRDSETDTNNYEKKHRFCREIEGVERRYMDFGVGEGSRVSPQNYLMTTFGA